jgi:DNA-binding NtrC family response regulator
MTAASRKVPRILVVEDDKVLLEELSGAIEDEGYTVVRAASAEDGKTQLAEDEYALVITDLRLPGASGLMVVEETRELLPDCPVLVVTAHASVDSAVEAMRLGAFHYLQKPLSVEAILIEVEKALEHGQVLRERTRLRERLSADQGLGRIVGESSVIFRARETIRQVASADSTVLVTGETGTGKELVANSLHYESPRAGGPLVKVNCAALSETLLESELFGHEKGAFTGADRRREGRFERADGGTLFLDEISEMGAHVQAKLLRVLQGEPFERVGGDKAIRPDVRLVAATNRDQEEAVGEGRIRKDLFYRLNIVRIEVPPLRGRREDVPLLVEHFVSQYSAKHGKRIGAVSDEALGVLKAHDWPGNVRELEACIERSVILVGGETIEKRDLPPPLCGSSARLPAVGEDTFNLQEVEKSTILRARDSTG